MDKFEPAKIAFKNNNGMVYSASKIKLTRQDNEARAYPLDQSAKNLTFWSTGETESFCTSYLIYKQRYECPNNIETNIDTPSTPCSGTTSIVLKARKYFDPVLKAIGQVDMTVEIPCTVKYSANYNDIYSPNMVLSAVQTNAQIPEIDSFVLIEKYGRYSFNWHALAKDCYISLTPTSKYNPYVDPILDCADPKINQQYAVFTTENNNRISWSSYQDEIYVFKIRALKTNSFCIFEYEFVLYVNGATMRLETQVLILSLSFLGMLLILVVLYMWYRREKVKL
eukprot:NODE_302_length_11399_cov_0.339115.p4 type:complete len:282 gc:universal NODE_302_length_11399_cov_0.339115:3942-3097(-)